MKTQKDSTGMDAMDNFGMSSEDFDLAGLDGKFSCAFLRLFKYLYCVFVDLISNYNAEMPDVNTKLFTDDNILSEFDDPMDDPTLMDFPSLDLPQIEPDFHISPPQVTVPQVMDNPVTPPVMLKPIPKTVPLIKPNRKLVEKPIQPNYIIEQNVDKKIRYIQKPGTHTLVPVQSIGQIHLQADQMKQVFLYLSYMLNKFKLDNCNIIYRFF